VIRETTALGAAYLAGLAVGLWQSRDEIKTLWQRDTVFTPTMEEIQRQELLDKWHKAVSRSRDWS
jgi:glycerol kinase